MNIDAAALGWAIFVWLIGLTAFGGFFMGRLFEKVSSHEKRLNEGQVVMDAIRAEQSTITTSFAELKSAMNEIRRYNTAIWRKLQST